MEQILSQSKNNFPNTIKKQYKKYKLKHRKNIDEDILYNKPRVITFEQPQPWTKIIFDEQNKYPYTFFINLDIPSFNDYHNWKQIIPTLNFLPHTKELTISTVNEEIALAIINLIIITFSNKLTLDDIISKDLINISITKVQESSDVKITFKNQIIQYLYSPQKNTNKQNTTQYDEQQLNASGLVLDSQTSSVNEQQQNNNMNFISAYDGSDYSYL